MSEMTVDDFKAGFAQAAGFETEQAPAPADTAEETTPAEELPVEAAETEVAEETPAEEPTAEQELLAGKYKDAEALEQGYKELERRFRERDNEIGELRKIAAAEPAAPAPERAYDPGAVDEYLADNPTQIPGVAQLAVETDDGFLYQKALAAWHEHDPAGAMNFAAQSAAAAQADLLRKEQQTAAETQARTAADFEAAYATAKARHPDFDTVIGSITQETLDGFPPETLAGLKSGDQESKERVLETLYRWTKAEQVESIQKVTDTVAAEQQAASQAAKEAATVATTTGTSDRGPVSRVDEWKDDFHNSDAFKKAAGLA